MHLVAVICLSYVSWQVQSNGLTWLPTGFVVSIWRSDWCDHSALLGSSVCRNLQEGNICTYRHLTSFREPSLNLDWVADCGLTCVLPGDHRLSSLHSSEFIVHNHHVTVMVIALTRHLCALVFVFTRLEYLPKSPCLYLSSALSCRLGRCDGTCSNLGRVAKYHDFLAVP
jgi:hypothetical protein